MSARLLILCPGQGGQHDGMFDMARADPQGGAMLGQFERAGLATDPALMFANATAQPMVVAAGLAIWEALRPHAPTPALVAGYSIGELTAYGVAGAMGAAETVALAQLRARLMSACLQDSGPQAMLAVSGLPLPRLAAPLAAHGFRVAIETGEDSCIAGGLLAGADRLEEELAAAGARCGRLPVEIASHTPLMQAAVAPFAQALRASALQAPPIPVLSGVAAQRIASREQAAEHLARQLSETIRWKDGMDACAEAGVTVALELGPGAALSRMLQARHPAIACRSVAEFRSVAGVLRWLERQAE